MNLGERERHFFTAEVVRFGWKHGFKTPQRTLLVKDVYLDGDNPRRVASHLWFIVGRQIENLALSVGEKIRFAARVKQYEKGYKGHRWDVDGSPVEKDWGLSFPNQFSRCAGSPAHGRKQGVLAL